MYVVRELRYVRAIVLRFVFGSSLSCFSKIFIYCAVNRSRKWLKTRTTSRFVFFFSVQNFPVFDRYCVIFVSRTKQEIPAHEISIRLSVKLKQFSAYKRYIQCLKQNATKRLGGTIYSIRTGYKLPKNSSAEQHPDRKSIKKKLASVYSFALHSVFGALHATHSRASAAYLSQ